MKVFIGILIGLFLGYFWGWSAMKQHIASPETCKSIYMKDPKIFQQFKESIYSDIFQYVDTNKDFYFVYKNNIYVITKK